MATVFSLSAVFLILFGFSSIYLFILGIKNRNLALLGLLILFLICGACRYNISLPKINQQTLAYYNQQQVEFIGLVNKEPDERQDKVKLTVSAQQIIFNDQAPRIKGQALLTVALYPQYQYGDKLAINCTLQPVKPIDNFAYDKYLARYNIYSLCYNPQIKLLASRQGNFFLTAIYDFKNLLISKINRILPEPQSSFLSGILIGAKKGLPSELANIFQKTGTSHLVAVSGYNVTIITAFLMALALQLGFNRKKSFWLLILLIIIFCILTGLQASIIRATIMAILFLTAQYLGRSSRVGNSILYAVVIMLLINPKLLVWDLGFQLSFLATLGLVYLNPILVSWLNVKKWSSKILQTVIGDYFLTTMSAIIMTTPIILYNSGNISLIAPLANLLVLPAIPLAMLLGFVAIVGALIFLPLGQIVAWFSWLILSYIIKVLDILAGLPGAFWQVTKISWWQMGLMYIFLCLFFSWLSLVLSKKKNPTLPR